MIIRIAALPMPYGGTMPAPFKAGNWSIAAGAVAWAIGGYQWVSILPKGYPDAMPLGTAGFHEVDGVLFADLRFNLEREEVRRWHRTIPRDPQKAREKLAVGWRLNPVKVDQAERLVTHVDVVALGVTVTVKPGEIWPWGRRRAAQPDPDSETIADLIEAAEQEQDRR